MSAATAAFAPGTLLMAGVLTVLTSAQGLLTAASKRPDGAYAYDVATVPFLAELAKLGISYLLLERQRRADPASIRTTRDLRTVALFIVPSVIYMVHNNVQVCCAGWVGVCWGRGGCWGGEGGGGAGGRGRGREAVEEGRAVQEGGECDWPSRPSLRRPSPVCCCRLQFSFLQHVDPATYQILGNLKIVSTGLLLRLALRRHLSRLQWMALLLLMAGAATSQINTDCLQGMVQSVLHAPFMVCAWGRGGGKDGDVGDGGWLDCRRIR